MKRYHKLLAGNSWMAEYGDPDTEVQEKGREVHASACLLLILLDIL